MHSEDVPAIRVLGLTKRYESRAAVSQLNLTVGEGDVYGFLGPNGAGKTTAMRCMLGLISVDSGSVELFGRPLSPSARENVGAIIETPCFHGWMSGRQNLQQAGWYRGLSGASLNAEIDRVLERVGLTERARDRARAYSLGMRQRLGLARALLGKPRLLFLDEPTNGLDPAGMREVRELIRSLAVHDRITLFMSSHLLSEVEAVCNRVGILAEGQLRAEGVVSELLASQDRPIYTLTTDDESLAARLQEQADVDVLDADSGAIRVRTERTAADLNRWCFEQGVVLAGLSTDKRDLEDVFLEVLR